MHGAASLTTDLLQACTRVALNPLMRQVLPYVVTRLVHRVVARLLLLLLLVAGAIQILEVVVSFSKFSDLLRPVQTCSDA